MDVISEKNEELEHPQKATASSLTINNEQDENPFIDEKQIFWPNDNKYEGEILNGLPHGYGTLVYNTGITYVGEFQEGKYHGQGTLTIPNEGMYVGEFKDGLFDGSGTFYYCEGTNFHWKLRKRRQTVWIP